MSGIVENYNVRLGEKDRVADHDCQVVLLEPKDNLRYGRSFCAEVVSGLPLRTRTINEQQETVESFAFTQLTLGGSFNRSKVTSKYAAKSRNWHVDRSALTLSEQRVDSGWVVNNQPPGFKKTMEIKRSITGRHGAVSHIVFSDGIAAVSVFIEPKPKERAAAAHELAHQGAVNIYTRSHAGNILTVLGEAPAATVMQIGNSLELRAAPVSVK
jgi:sigma-E factor negative regulatory protein RseB